MSAVIDAHVHLYRAHSAEYPRVVLDIFPPEAEERAETFLELMAAHGVDRAVVVGLGPELRYLDEVLLGWPDRFAGIGVVGEDDPDPAATYLEHHDRSGLWGMRVMELSRAASARTDARLERLMAALERTGGVLWCYVGPAQIPALATAAEAHPDLPIVLNHLAFFPDAFAVDADGNRVIHTSLPPPTLDTVAELAAHHPNLYVVVSGQYAFSARGWPYRDLDATVRRVYAAFGPERMAWGSDHPASLPSAPYGQQLALVDSALPGLDAGERAAIMGGTIERLLARRR